MPSEPPRRRLQRIDGRGHARFLTFSCFHNQPFLRSDRACIWLVEAISRARDRHRFQLWAWVAMPTHVHLLLHPARDADRVGPILTTIKQSVAVRTLAHVRRTAPDFLARMADTAPSGVVTHRFWQRGAGYDRNIRNRITLWETIRYIHANPVNNRLCMRPEDWPWSSAREFRQRGAGPIPIDFDTLPPAW